MAFALHEVYKNRNHPDCLTLEDYRGIGGVKGAVRRRAEDTLQSLDRDSQNALDSIFPLLVNMDTRGTATRRRATSESIRRTTLTTEPVKALCDARLLVSGEDDDQQSTVEIAHEALLESWPRLRNWIREHRIALEARIDLEAAAQSWNKSGRPRWSGLPSGSLLRRYRHAAKTESADEFLDACELLDRLRKGVTGVIAVLFLSVLGFVWWTGREDLSVKAGIWVLLAKTGLYYLEPKMVRIPEGSFLMGSKDDAEDALSSEKPQHVVKFDKPFWIGKFEVTFDEYDVFRVIENQKKPLDAGWGRGNQPVIDVSWKDAVAYVEWLSEKTGKRYRLPTEAEWEYVARDGTETRYWWGDELIKNRANCRDCGSKWDGDWAVPVGSFDPNDFQVYDTAGNVYEWVQDCWYEDYTDAPANGHVVWDDKNSGDCSRRVIRGGFWGGNRRYVRSANRDGGWLDARLSIIGFRLAQD